MEEAARVAVHVRRAIRSCSRCSLRAEAVEPIPWYGPLQPEIAVLGEAPGRMEEQEHRPFIGPAGQLLRTILAKNGILPDSVTYLNAACCYPSQSRTPTQEHLDLCRTHLVGQLAVIQPALLLVVGISALTALIGPQYSMKDIRARPLFVERLEPWTRFTTPITAWCTYHPAAALRSTAYRLKVEEDVAKFVEWKEEMLFPEECLKCGKEVERFDEYGVAWCNAHAGKQGRLL